MSDPALQAVPNFNKLEIVKSGTLTIPDFTMSLLTTNTYTGTANSEIDTHNLGYVPAVIAFIENGVLMPFTSVSAGGTGGGLLTTSYDITMGGTTIQAQANAVGYGGYSWAGAPIAGQTIRYYLFKEVSSV